ncbi:MAG: hypothetical protein Q9218_007831 [Villophora microphyllina]
MQTIQPSEKAKPASTAKSSTEKVPGSNLKAKVVNKPGSTATTATEQVAPSNPKPKPGDKPASTAITATEKVTQSNTKPVGKKAKPEKNATPKPKPMSLLDAAPSFLKEAAKHGKIAR